MQPVSRILSSPEQETPSQGTTQNES